MRLRGVKVGHEGTAGYLIIGLMLYHNCIHYYNCKGDVTNIQLATKWKIYNLTIPTRTIHARFPPTLKRYPAASDALLYCQCDLSQFGSITCVSRPREEA